MPNKKGSESEKSPEEQALEQRVDAMLNPKGDKSPITSPAAGPDKDKPLDIFEGKSSPVKITVKDSSAPAAATTAPEVPGKVLKEAGVRPTKVVAEKVSAPEPAPKQAAAVEVPAADESAAAPTPDVESTSTNIEDTATDKAVDDIAANDSDALLAAEDAARSAKTPAAPKKSSGGNWKDKLRALARNKWTWVGVAVLLVALFALPFTRYKVLGLVIKESVAVKVLDSKTNTPVSNAEVALGGASGKTNAEGVADLRAAVGSSKLEVTKQYYTSYNSKVTVGFKAANANVNLVATGRQVPLTVTNKITGKPLTGAEIKILNTTAKTDSKGKATVVLPATAANDNATVTLSGYNTASASVVVTSDVVPGNTIQLTPSGHIYFLSNLSGKIDVVKTNLDGSGRKTVFAGTGNEDPNTTSLLASRDWRYLVLKSQHDGSRAALYLIDASNDTVTSFDTNNSDFQLIGWINHNFVYDASSNTVPQSQAGHDVIKSYDADHQQLNQLDQNQVDGAAGSYGYQSFANFYILNNELAYTTQWYSVGGFDISNKSDTIRTVQPGAQSKKDVQSVSADGIVFTQGSLYEPQTAYYEFYNGNENKGQFYSFENQLVSPANNLTQADLNKAYPTYLLSPSGSQTFWTELRDGKNTLFTGSANAQNPKQIANLSDFSPYGWYTDAYTLVSKNSSELYIMPAAGPGLRPPLKITDYYKPAQTLNGYGYGYGGL